MSRYFRTEILVDGQVADPYAVDRDARRAAESWNGDVDSLQMGPGVVTGTELAANSCNRYYIETSPFGVGTFTLEREDVTSRSWTYPDDGTVEWVADEDGVVAGAFEYTIRYYGQASSTINYGWAIGIFLDGVLVGRTEKNLLQFDSGGLPFHGVVTKGAHTLRLGILVYSYPASTATDPEDVVTIFSSMIWWRHARR